jgi:hypothetical protein
MRASASAFCLTILCIGAAGCESVPISTTDSADPIVNIVGGNSTTVSTSSVDGPVSIDIAAGEEAVVLATANDDGGARSVTVTVVSGGRISDGNGGTVLSVTESNRNNNGNALNRVITGGKLVPATPNSTMVVKASGTDFAGNTAESSTITFRFNGPAQQVPSANYALSVVPISNTVVWGDTATYEVTVTGQSSFTGTVEVTAATSGNMELPQGATSSSLSLQLNSSASSASGTLSIQTTEAATELGRSMFRVDAASTSGLQRAETESITVLRKPGYFTNVWPLRDTDSSCGPVTAMVKPGPRVEFSGPWRTTSVRGTGLYDFAPQCRAGAIALTEVSYAFYNFAFPSHLGARPLGNLIVTANPIEPVKLCFSPDDSIVLAIYRSTGSGTNQDSIAGAWDLITGRVLGRANHTGDLPCAMTPNANDVTRPLGIRVDGNKVIGDGVAPDGREIRFEFNIF